MTAAYYLCDPAAGDVEKCESLDEALAGAAEIIKSYRDECDPEWPMGVEDVCIVYGESVAEHDDAIWQYLPVTHKAVEINKQTLDPEDAEVSGVEYECEYGMEAVNAKSI